MATRKLLCPKCGKFHSNHSCPSQECNDSITFLNKEVEKSKSYDESVNELGNDFAEFHIKEFQDNNSEETKDKNESLDLHSREETSFISRGNLINSESNEENLTEDNTDDSFPASRVSDESLGNSTEFASSLVVDTSLYSNDEVLFISQLGNPLDGSQVPPSVADDSNVSEPRNHKNVKSSDFRESRNASRFDNIAGEACRPSDESFGNSTELSSSFILGTSLHSDDKISFASKTGNPFDGSPIPPSVADNSNVLEPRSQKNVTSLDSPENENASGDDYVTEVVKLFFQNKCRNNFDNTSSGSAMRPLPGNNSADPSDGLPLQPSVADNSNVQKPCNPINVMSLDLFKRQNAIRNKEIAKAMENSRLYLPNMHNIPFYNISRGSTRRTLPGCDRGNPLEESNFFETNAISLDYREIQRSISNDNIAKVNRCLRFFQQTVRRHTSNNVSSGSTRRATPMYNEYQYEFDGATVFTLPEGIRRSDPFESEDSGRPRSKSANSRSKRSFVKTFPCHQCGRVYIANQGNNIHQMAHTISIHLGRVEHKLIFPGTSLCKHSRRHTK